ncbi:MAG: molybdopterin molybdotransferase MoeA [Chloroflexi bacterium]|nr:molybdopterin molybdotransferase MoeA [Chloroflexota bacterium]MCI0892930.1 molybdopterin molybdotransferase MoeA [Chloroflexota bacterium]
MPEFLELANPNEALRTFLAAIHGSPRAERVRTEDTLDRVLLRDVVAPSPLPPFPRTTVDGYAVRASDTFGASPGMPGYLKVVGEILMGTVPELEVGEGQAVVIHTGGMLPSGADAVVMIEDTQAVDDTEIEVLKPVADGQNVLHEGEDVQPGDVVIQAGTRIRAQEIGGLLALGFGEVEVAEVPRVAILSTGDEVVPPSEEPAPGQVRDINSYTLSALVERAGGRPVRYGIIPDNAEALETIAKQAHSEHHMLLITAGSSVSERDITADVIAELGEPGILVHGIALRPGKPTILSLCDGVPVVGLPGNPVSALVVAGLFVLPAIRKLQGYRGPEWSPTISASLQTNVSSVAGREDWLPCRLIVTSDGLEAEPVFGRSNLIFTLVRADGLVRIPAASTGLDAGEEVEVRLF